MSRRVCIRFLDRNTPTLRLPCTFFNCRFSACVSRLSVAEQIALVEKLSALYFDSVTLGTSAVSAKKIRGTLVEKVAAEYVARSLVASTHAKSASSMNAVLRRACKEARLLKLRSFPSYAKIIVAALQSIVNLGGPESVADESKEELREFAKWYLAKDAGSFASIFQQFRTDRILRRFAKGLRVPTSSILGTDGAFSPDVKMLTSVEDVGNEMDIPFVISELILSRKMADAEAVIAWLFASCQIDNMPSSLIAHGSAQYWEDRPSAENQPTISLELSLQIPFVDLSASSLKEIASVLAAKVRDVSHVEDSVAYRSSLSSLLLGKHVLGMHEILPDVVSLLLETDDELTDGQRRDVRAATVALLAQWTTEQMDRLGHLNMKQDQKGQDISALFEQLARRGEEISRNRLALVSLAEAVSIISNRWPTEPSAIGSSHLRFIKAVATLAGSIFIRTTDPCRLELAFLGAQFIALFDRLLDTRCDASDLPLIKVLSATVAAMQMVSLEEEESQRLWEVLAAFIRTLSETGLLSDIPYALKLSQSALSAIPWEGPQVMAIESLMESLANNIGVVALADFVLDGTCSEQRVSTNERKALLKMIVVILRVGQHSDKMDRDMKTYARSSRVVNVLANLFNVSEPGATEASLALEALELVIRLRVSWAVFAEQASARKLMLFVSVFVSGLECAQTSWRRCCLSPSE